LFSITDELEGHTMKFFNFRSVFAIAAMAVLAACGGSAPPDQGEFTSTAAVMANGNAPVADCEAEGCNQPRIVDGLAEQYRFGAVQQQQQEQQLPAGLTVTAESPVPVATVTEAAPAAAVQAQ
jgi:hypothetical protein